MKSKSLRSLRAHSDELWVIYEKLPFFCERGHLTSTNRIRLSDPEKLSNFILANFFVVMTIYHRYIPGIILYHPSY